MKPGSSKNVIPSRNSNSQSLARHVNYEQFIAGCVGGGISTLILHPLDLLKIRFQVHEGVSGVKGISSIKRPEYRGVVHAFQSIIKCNGVTGLWQGVVPNVTGASLSWGLYFLVYNGLKGYMQDGDSSVNLGAGKNMGAAAVSGLFTLACTNPVWVVKTRLCLQYDQQTLGRQALKTTPGHYSGMFDALRKIWSKEGIRGLYKGFVPGMFGVTHGAIQFMVYEELKTWHYKKHTLDNSEKLDSVHYIMYAATSKIVAACMTYPYQVVRSRLQEQHRQYKGIMDVLRQIWKYERIPGFYKGIAPYLIHVVPNICIVFWAYEILSGHIERLKPRTKVLPPHDCDVEKVLVCDIDRD